VAHEAALHSPAKVSRTAFELFVDTICPQLTMHVIRQFNESINGADFSLTPLGRSRCLCSWLSSGWWAAKDTFGRPGWWAH